MSVLYGSVGVVYNNGNFVNIDSMVVEIIDRVIVLCPVSAPVTVGIFIKSKSLSVGDLDIINGVGEYRYGNVKCHALVFDCQILLAA